jgi:hypothetical protein
MNAFVSRSATRPVAVAIFLTLCLFVTGCSRESELGPPTPSGATDIGGPPMISMPPPPPGWNPKEVVPQSQQQAQDTLLGYVQRTVQSLPPGTVFDATRYAGIGSGNLVCDDNATSPNAPTQFGATGDLKFAPGTDLEAMVAKTGEIWRSWGWHVIERDGFRKPNQFGYSQDGYKLQIVTAAREGYPPTLEGSTPCFPGELARNDIPFPPVVQGN